MCDDFNSPILISHLFDCIKFINKVNTNKASVSKKDLDLINKTLNEFIFEILGLKNESNQEKRNTLKNTIELLLEIREEARKENNFSLSDKIRDQLISLGIIIKDNEKGSSFEIQ